MLTHLSIFKGQARILPVGISNPTTRENAEYLVDLDTDLQDGDWYYNTSTNVLGILVGSTWNFIGFTATT